ncbi:Alpha/Beta hydrolase protein [Microdochium bolleyi]|uniref:Alpha/Beta hydrolase protein n=1 Tax=Microdochium bolleyi TaxID=196109 RepID=A0A136IMB8_9PEZI|nr:Alpha/Beta hydrolase protein [Microdochium bolleyi]
MPAWCDSEFFGLRDGACGGDGGGNPGRAVTAAAAAAAMATVAAAGLAGMYMATSRQHPSSSASGGTSRAVTPSPLTTQVPHLTPAQVAALPYPPTTAAGSAPEPALPGGRDVPTAYGSVRVYEWGPVTGEKVLLVHGISTPCIALGDLAWELVGRGYRVMLFDLFGRGYSDAPTDVPYDARLYTTQILLVLASSELSWLGAPSSSSPATTTTGNDTDGGSGGFHLVGYSLGGCLCVAFAAQFPHILRSLSLVATSGLIRQHHIGRASRLLYESGWLPERLVREMVRRRIRPASAPAPAPGDAASELRTAGARAGEKNNGVDSGASAKSDGLEALMLGEATQTDPSSARAQEGHAREQRGKTPMPADNTRKSQHSDASGGAAFDSASLSRHRPDVTVSSVVRWQVDQHEGFIGAFLGTIRAAPIYAPSGDADWTALRGILSSSLASASASASGEEDEGVVVVREDGEGGREGGRKGLAAKGKILIVLGGKDSVIDCEETVADATAILNGGGEGSAAPSRVDFAILPDAGHEVVITASAEVANALVGHWGREGATVSVR